jgi:hypothetical protein
MRNPRNRKVIYLFRRWYNGERAKAARTLCANSQAVATCEKSLWPTSDVRLGSANSPCPMLCNQQLANALSRRNPCARKFLTSNPKDLYDWRP